MRCMASHFDNHILPIRITKKRPGVSLVVGNAMVVCFLSSEGPHWKLYLAPNPSIPMLISELHS